MTPQTHSSFSCLFLSQQEAVLFHVSVGRSITSPNSVGEIRSQWKTHLPPTHRIITEQTAKASDVTEPFSRL